MAGSRKRRRWANITVGTLLALVLVFYVGGGIVFSNMIYVDALTPQPPTPDHGVYVTAVGDETITLSSPEERETPPGQGSPDCPGTGALARSPTSSRPAGWQ